MTMSNPRDERSDSERPTSRLAKPITIEGYRAGLDIEARVKRATDELLRGLRAQGDAAGQVLDRRATHRPDRAEAERALQTLVDFSAARERDDYDRLVETLVQSPTVDANRLHQARLHAERKRHLIETEVLLGTDELVRLMPDRIRAGGNASRTLQGLRDRHELLGVRLMREWRYPACQLDAQGEVFAALPAVLRIAHAQGYTPWEVLHWLAAPGPAPAGPVVPGRALEPTGTGETLGEIARRAIAQHANDPLPPAPVRPIAVLAGGDVATFEHLAGRWLGVPDLATG